MIDLNHNTNAHFREIEDIIDARKLLGQYNVHKQSNGMSFRHIYSNSTGTSTSTNKNVNVDDTVVLNDKDIPSIKPTDSEITIVRVRCDDINHETIRNKWDMHDIAIPGDGSHLGESPSMVNLATLVGRNILCEGEEYLVPLSSWDPYLKPEDINTDLKCCSELNFDKPIYKNTHPENKSLLDNEITEQGRQLKNEGIEVFRRRSWAGKISKFIRKHCKKSKTLPAPAPDQNVNKN